LEGAVIVAKGPSALLQRFNPTAASRRLGRRWDRITACEPRLDGQARAAGRYIGVLHRRHPRIAAVGVGVGVGLGLGLLAE